MSSEHPALAKLRAMRPRFSQLGIERVRVFGSVARGEAREDSDIDLLVDFTKTPDLWTFMDVKDEFEQSLACRVDLVTSKGLHWALKDSILSEARDV
jgi:predicted nucleotidyltransferase